MVKFFIEREKQHSHKNGRARRQIANTSSEALYPKYALNELHPYPFSSVPMPVPILLSGEPLSKIIRKQKYTSSHAFSENWCTFLFPNSAGQIPRVIFDRLLSYG